MILKYVVVKQPLQYLQRETNLNLDYVFVDPVHQNMNLHKDPRSKAIWSSLAIYMEIMPHPKVRESLG